MSSLLTMLPARPACAHVTAFPAWAVALLSPGSGWVLVAAAGSATTSARPKDASVLATRPSRRVTRPPVILICGNHVGADYIHPPVGALQAGPVSGSTDE